MTDKSFSPAPEAPVLVIGGAGIDLVGRLRGDLIPGTSNPAHIRISHGGVARNVAENLARLGQPVTLITALGEDSAGDQLIQQAAAAGIDVSCVLRTPEHPTGTYFAVLNSQSMLQFALDDINATSALTPQYVRSCADRFQEASLVFLDANLPRDTLRTIFSLARKAGLPVCADPTSTSLAGRIKPYLNRLALVAPNSAEASILCEMPVSDSSPQQALNAAKCLVSHGVQISLVSLAEFGVVYAASEISGHVPAVRTRIVDPTGAGDALTATVIFALLNGIPLDDSVRLGVTAASITLRHRGTVVQNLSLEMLYDQLVI